ncbi:MAG TPA: hypothetical protein PK878_13210 [bacterium]|nr:hypothetical protein [bacterium]HOL95360.1 hypothetical protein [bacterium]HPP02309.1 hypothetical protein [bacterium]
MLVSSLIQADRQSLPVVSFLSLRERNGMRVGTALNGERTPGIHP